MTKEEVKLDMRSIIINREFSGLVIGEDSIHKEFENKQYIPTCIDKVIKEKANRDYDTIFEALYLLEGYRAEGLTHFDFNLDIILNKIIPKQK